MICYLNSTLQCFYHCRPLKSYFLNLDYKKAKAKGMVTSSYYDLIYGLNKGNSNAAKNIKETMIFIDPSFRGREGKDSKDVVVFLLDQLQRELKASENTVYGVNEDLDYYNLSEVYEDRKLTDEENYSIIIEVFNYHVRREQKCLTRLPRRCEKGKKTLYNIDSENFFFFSLENIWKKLNRNPKMLYLEECFEDYVQQKTIKCTSCGKTNLELKTFISSLPKILIIILSRGQRNHFSCDIKYEHTLDMKKFYSPIGKENKSICTKYELIGATFLYEGSEKGTGHTVAFCKGYNDNYYVFDDLRVRLTNIDEIKKQKPYLLFYQRKY